MKQLKTKFLFLFLLSIICNARNLRIAGFEYLGKYTEEGGWELEALCGELTEASNLLKSKTSLQKKEFYSHFNTVICGPDGNNQKELIYHIAKLSGAEVIEISGDEIVDQYYGGSNKNLQDLLDKARKLSDEKNKPVIILINNIDEITDHDSVKENFQYSVACSKICNILDEIEKSPNIFFVGTMSNNLYVRLNLRFRSRVFVVNITNPDKEDRHAFITRSCEKQDINLENTRLNNYWFSRNPKDSDEIKKLVLEILVKHSEGFSRHDLEKLMIDIY